MPYCHRFMKGPESSSRIFDAPVEHVQLKQGSRDILFSVEGIDEGKQKHPGRVCFRCNKAEHGLHEAKTFKPA